MSHDNSDVFSTPSTVTESLLLLLSLVFFCLNGRTTSVCNQPRRTTQPPALSDTGNEYWPPFHQIGNDDCVKGKRENYHVCSVQYSMQQLCTVQCTHIWTDLTVVSWLDLAFLWLYCGLQFICVKIWLFKIFLCYSLFVYVCFCWLHLVSSDCLGRTSPKWPILCRVGDKTLTPSINRVPAKVWVAPLVDRRGWQATCAIPELFRGMLLV